MEGNYLSQSRLKTVSDQLKGLLLHSTLMKVVLLRWRQRRRKEESGPAVELSYA